MIIQNHGGQQDNPEYGVCPRCGENTLRLDRPALNSLSRTDNETYVCSGCGTSEALEDLARGLSRQSKDSWKAPDAAEQFTRKE